MDIQRLQQDMEALRSQIVESPERLQNVTKQNFILWSLSRTCKWVEWHKWQYSFLQEIKDLHARIQKENVGTSQLKENLAQLMNKERERLKCVKTLNKCTVSLNNFGENLKKCKRESKALKQQNNSITILTAKLKELKATKAVGF